MPRQTTILSLGTPFRFKRNYPVAAMELDLETATLNGQLPAIHPGVLLGRSVLAKSRLSPRAISERLGLSFDDYNYLLDGKKQIDPELAERIALVVGGSAEIWLRLQATFDKAPGNKLGGPSLG